MEGMNVTEVSRKGSGTFAVSVGHRLSCKYWANDEADRKIAALVFISHGFGEHCRWYNKLAQILVDADCYAFAHDHYGHGESQGERGQISDFKYYVNDVIEHVEAVKALHPDVKVFIVGHSMGGLIAAHAAYKKPDLFSGAVFIGPGFDFYSEYNVITVSAVKVLGSLVPSFPMAKIDPAVISRDEAMVKAYAEDPLVYHEKIKAKWLTSYKRSQDELRAVVSEIKWPFLLMHGTEDKLTGMKASVEFHDKAQSKDKTLRIYEGYYHQLHSEPEPYRTEVCNEIRDWIIARI